MPKEYPKYRGMVPIHWNWYRDNTHRYKELVDQSLTYFEGCKGRILDIGSGDGLIDHLLAQKGFKVIGVEPDFDGIGIAFGKVTYEYLLSTTIESYVRKAMQEVDYMYSMNTIEHVQDPQAFVKAMASVKEFGIVITDNATVNKEVDKYHEREYTLQQLQHLFKDFRTEVIDTLNDNFIGIKIYAKGK